MKRLVYFLIGLFSAISYGQMNHSIQEIEEKLLVENRPIFLFITTNWCTICPIQKHQISNDIDLIQLFDEQIYFVPFDAESEQEFVLKNQLFHKKINQYHDFVLALFENETEISFPTWIIFNNDFEEIFRATGLLKTKELKMLIQQLKTN